MAGASEIDPVQMGTVNTANSSLFSQSDTNAFKKSWGWDTTESDKMYEGEKDEEEDLPDLKSIKQPIRYKQHTSKAEHELKDPVQVKWNVGLQPFLLFVRPSTGADAGRQVGRAVRLLGVE